MCGQGNDLGYGKNAKDEQWTICSQVLRDLRRKGDLMDAVHRLNGGGRAWGDACLRYSRATVRAVTKGGFVNNNASSFNMGNVKEVYLH
jgi:hypothetical protein